MFMAVNAKTISIKLNDTTWVLVGIEEGDEAC